MKVPKYIKNAILRCSYYNSKAKKYELQIYNWLDKNKLSDDTCDDYDMSVSDSFIDLCLYGEDNGNLFIDLLERII